MPSRKFAFEKGGPKRVELSWRGSFKDTRVIVDGQELGVIPNRKALKQGASFVLPDGGTLSVGFAGSGLVVARDGVPLPGSTDDPASQIAAAGGVLYFIGGFSVLMGIASLFVESEYLDRVGGVYNLGGVLFIALAWLATAKRSMVALIIGLALWIVNIVLTLVTTLSASGSPGYAIILQIMFAWIMIRAIPAYKKEGAIEASRRATNAFD